MFDIPPFSYTEKYIPLLIQRISPAFTKCVGFCGSYTLRDACPCNCPCTLRYNRTSLRCGWERYRKRKRRTCRKSIELTNRELCIVSKAYHSVHAFFLLTSFVFSQWYMFCAPSWTSSLNWIQLMKGQIEEIQNPVYRKPSICLFVLLQLIVF